jgi:hypothetical protein
MDQQSTSFVLEFVPGKGKDVISNTLRLTTKSGNFITLLSICFFFTITSFTGLPAQIKLPTKPVQARCGIPMPKIDAKITDKFDTVV